uniref:RING-type domain-containing protein n=1 Tax=Macrostomum lignano TaxID=282301 RepID=A0A1I8JI27_9PLAT
TDQLHHEAWIGLVYPKESDWFAPSTCNRLAEQTRRAAKRGAVGLVFDVRNAHGHLRKQLMEAGKDQEGFNITVAIVDSRDATNLDLLESLDLAKYHAKVDIRPASRVKSRYSGHTGNRGHETTRMTFYAEIAAFLLFFLAFCIIGIGLLVKFYSYRETNNTAGTLLIRNPKMAGSAADQHLTQHLRRKCCSTCLEPFQNTNEPHRTLPCGHGFHLQCLNNWLVANQTCPICNHNILGEPPLEEDNTMETMTTTATATTAVALETAVSDEVYSSNYSVLCDDGPTNISNSKFLSNITTGKTNPSRETTL